MTNYSFRSQRLPLPAQSQDDAFTRQNRRRVAQRKAERKAVLDRIRAQRASAFRQLLKKRKTA